MRDPSWVHVSQVDRQSAAADPRRDAQFIGRGGSAGRASGAAVTANTSTHRWTRWTTTTAEQTEIDSYNIKRGQVGGEQRDGVTAKLHLEDDTTLVAGAGAVLELDTGHWQVVAVREGEPHGEVVFEPAA